MNRSEMNRLLAVLEDEIEVSKARLLEAKVARDISCYPRDQVTLSKLVLIRHVLTIESERIDTVGYPLVHTPQGSVSRLRTNQEFLLLAILHGPGDEAFASRLAERLRGECSLRVGDEAVRNALHHMEHLGWVERESPAQRFHSRLRQPDYWRITPKGVLALDAQLDARRVLTGAGVPDHSEEIEKWWTGRGRDGET